MDLTNLNFSNLKKQFKENIILIILIIITTIGSTYFVYNVLKSPTYESNFQVLFNSSSSQGEIQQLDSYKTNIQLMSTVSSIIKSSKVMEEVKKVVDIGVTAKEASKKVTVQSDTNSLVINVGFSSDNPKDVELVSNNLLKVIQNEIPATFNNSTITVLEVPTKPMKVSLLPNYVLSIFVGIFISSTLIIIKSTIDTRIKTPEQIKELGIRYLGDIPNMKGRWK